VKFNQRESQMVVLPRDHREHVLETKKKYSLRAPPNLDGAGGIPEIK